MLVRRRLPERSHAPDGHDRLGRRDGVGDVPERLRYRARRTLAGSERLVALWAKSASFRKALDALAACDLVAPAPIGADGNAAGSVLAPRGEKAQQKEDAHSASLNHGASEIKMRICAGGS